uniref:HAT C-terminal dimerisation domain-containing protein n=1 Tax=Moniliophthora roreri TaxID=221103 RepID=A0A0W0FMI0_MONRR
MSWQLLLLVHILGITMIRHLRHLGMHLSPNLNLTFRGFLHAVADFTHTLQKTAGTGKVGWHEKCADDIHTLFTETEMEYICNICLELKSKSEFPETFKVQTYKLSSGITNMHNHLMLPTHLPIWIAHCDHLGIPIKALLIIKKVEAYQNEHGVEVPAVLATQVFSKFSIEGLTQLLMEVIITKNLPITFVESEQTTMMKVIIKTWHQKMYELAAEMKLTLSKISFTCDGWTDLNLFPFIAITAHWIKEVVILEKTKCGIQMQTLLEFHSDVIAFHEVLVSHTGAHLKEAFLYLVNWLGLLKKIGWITCNNATNNDTMFERLEYQLEGIGIDFYYLHNHIRCFAHIIHLAVTVILHFMNEEDLAAIFAQRDGGTLPSTHKPGVLTRTRGMVQEQNFEEGTIKAEAATYLYKDTTLVSDKKDGLVKYWEANHEKYPTIFALAVDLLLIQGTSVPCNELMAATQILKNSIKHNSPLNFTRHYNQSNEMTELEEIIHQDEDHIPDTVDVETFRRNLPTVSFVQ